MAATLAMTMLAVAEDLLEPGLTTRNLKAMVLLAAIVVSNFFIASSSFMPSELPWLGVGESIWSAIDNMPFSLSTENCCGESIVDNFPFYLFV